MALVHLDSRSLSSSRAHLVHSDSLSSSLLRVHSALLGNRISSQRVALVRLVNKINSSLSQLLVLARLDSRASKIRASAHLVRSLPLSQLVGVQLNNHSAQPQGNAPFSAFASNATSTPTAGTSAFGQNQQNQQNQSPFGAFGQQNNQANQQQGANPLLKPSVFGTPAGGLFGNTGQQQQQQQPQQGGGLFGNTGQSQQQSGGLFGNTASGTGGMFNIRGTLPLSHFL